MVSLQGIQDQRFIGLGDLQVGESAAVGEVELGDDRLHRETRQFRVHLDVNGLVGLDSDDQLVAGNVLEDTRGHISELDADLGLLLIQSCGVSAPLIARSEKITCQLYLCLP